MLSHLKTEQLTSNEDYKTHPTQLDEAQRARHVVDALRDYNKDIIDKNPEGATAKFDKLVASPFPFLRGTADLMYQDFKGTDADMTEVMCMGDVHLDNFGVMETVEGSLIWGLNDFDEATFGPFAWDVKRGATSIIVAARDQEIEDADAESLAKIFVASYLKALRRFADGDGMQKPQFTRRRGPGLIRQLIRETGAVSRKKFWRRYIDPETQGFRRTKEIEPITDRKDEFQDAMVEYLASLSEWHDGAPESIRVLDVAEKEGSGIGSVGLRRYYALADVVMRGEKNRVLLEIKYQRQSVMAPYVGDGPLLFPSNGYRVAFAEDIQLPDANPYYGHTTVDDKSCLVRKRSPYKARIKLKKLKRLKDLRNYVKACGKALAYAHARSDRIVSGGQSTANRILHSVNQRTYPSDISHFASHTAEQVRRDWKTYETAHREGHFRFRLRGDRVGARPSK